MFFVKFIFIVISITSVGHGQTFPFNVFTNSPIVGNLNISKCGKNYSGTTTSTQRWESYSWTSPSLYQSITFSTCRSSFDTTLQLYHYDTSWTPTVFSDDVGSCSPQSELPLSNLVPGDYILEISSFNGETFGAYKLTSHTCILAATPQISTTETLTAPTTNQTSGSVTTTTASTTNSNGNTAQESPSSGVSTDLLTQICIAIAVYAVIPFIFYFITKMCCKQKEKETETTASAVDEVEENKNKPSIVKAYVIAMIDIFDSSTDIISGYNFFFIKGCGILACQSETLSSFDAYGYTFIICGSIGALITICKNILLYYEIKNLHSSAVDSSIGMKIKILSGRLEAGKILLCDIPIAACFIVLLMVNQYDLSFAMKISLTITFCDLLILTLFYCKEWQATSRNRMQQNMNQHINEDGEVVYANYDVGSVLRAQMCNSDYCMYGVLIIFVFILGLELSYAWTDIVKGIAPKMLTLNGECFGESGTFATYSRDGYSVEASWWSWNLELEIGSKIGGYGSTEACVEHALDYGECLNIDPTQYQSLNCSNMGTSPIQICVDRCTLDN